MNKRFFGFYSLLLFMFSVCFIPACKKEKCKAGAGGNLSLRLYMKHHQKAIPGCTVRIKYGAQDFPGANGSYDATITAGSADTSVTFSGLYCGDYYIYGTGIDSSLTSTDKSVSGGIPYSTSQENGTIELVLPITE